MAGLGFAGSGQAPPEDTRIAGVPDEFEEAWHKRNVERNWRTLDAVGEVAEETGKSYPQVALNWLLRQPGVTAPIASATSVKQVEELLPAMELELTTDHLDRLTNAGA